jgi:hypothetical protein
MVKTTACKANVKPMATAQVTVCFDVFEPVATALAARAIAVGSLRGTATGCARTVLRAAARRGEWAKLSNVMLVMAAP